jgi:diketogulonate reductase-like aldo/keto reductase
LLKIISFVILKENPGVDAFPKDQNGKILFSDVHYTETYKSIEQYVGQGFVKSIGLCNFNKQQLQDILRVCAIKPVINQVKSNNSALNF